MSNKPAGFHIAPFAIDGELEGIGFFDESSLTEAWLNICRKHLKTHGNNFDAAWSENFPNIRTRLTSASQIAMATFSINNNPVASAVFASGKSPAVETEVMRMFVDSLRRVQLVSQAARSINPFEKVLEIRERPLVVVVPWAEPAVSEQDDSTVRELVIHLASAFLQQS